jgi:hypothetical protein
MMKKSTREKTENLLLDKQAAIDNEALTRKSPFDEKLMKLVPYVLACVT